jgi:hypothetical protein
VPAEATRPEKAQAALDRGGECGEAVAQILHKGMAANHSVSASRTLEASHRPKPLLEVAVVSLQTIIQVLRAAMLRGGEDSTNGGRIARRLVGYDTFWHFACPGDRPFEEGLRRSSVAPCALKYASTTWPS